jgi:hypothetical protein
VDWIQVKEGSVQWLRFVNTLTKLLLPQKTVIISWQTASFLGGLCSIQLTIWLVSYTVSWLVSQPINRSRVHSVPKNIQRAELKGNIVTCHLVVTSVDQPKCWTVRPGSVLHASVRPAASSSSYLSLHLTSSPADVVSALRSAHSQQVSGAQSRNNPQQPLTAVTICN